MKPILFSILLFYKLNCLAQTTVSGIVTDPKGIPIVGANIYLDGTYDGSSTDTKGAFNFTTTETGMQTLVVSFLSFETFTKSFLISEMNTLQIKLKEDVNALDSVILNAGTFAAGGNSKASVLTPMDIVTTAGAAGDYIGAIRTLPGNSNVAEDGRLFVRGGDASEANVFIDGLRVFQPFNVTANNVPTRGRFSSFLFKGTNFSTGGYSAEYGNALSSVLLLNTIDEPVQEKTEISLISVGAGVGNTQKWHNNSLSVNTFYLNLKPYQEVISQRIDWIKPFESFSGEAIYRHKFRQGLLKVYGGLSYTNFQLIQEDIDVPGGVPLDLENRNLYLNTSYEGSLGATLKLYAGVSFANDKNAINLRTTDVLNREHTAHLKVKLRKRFSNNVKWSFGLEQFLGDFSENGMNSEFGNFENQFQNNNTAAFTETNIFFSKKLGMQLGIRGERNTLLKYAKLSPRASLAYKINSYAQVSLAYGDFYQDPNQEVLKYNTALEPQKSSHYIANYLYQKNRKTLRAEAYYKGYDDLIKYNTDIPLFTSEYNNLGDGYARGLDLFWRDNSSIKNLEYWASYSYLDTERDYQNFPVKATPNFAATHNTSLVTKYQVRNWKSMIGATYNYASGRPYTNSNTRQFLSEKTKSFTALNLNWAYLISQQKILYVSITNVFGSEQIFNYQYARNPNANGDLSRRAIRPNADRFFIVGFFWTISDDKKDNQLDNL